MGTALLRVMDRVWQRRGDRWMPEEDDLIRRLAGRVSALGIATELTRVGHPRTVGAVRHHAENLGIYLSLEIWSLSGICHLFGGGGGQGQRLMLRKMWFETGLIHARNLQMGLYTQWRVEEHDLETFIRHCPWAYDARRMQPSSHRLARLALAVQTRDPWWGTTQARAYLGLSASRFSRLCAEGMIPAKRRYIAVTGASSGGLVVRAADMPETKRAIESRRQAGREYIASHLQELMRQRRSKAA